MSLTRLCLLSFLVILSGCSTIKNQIIVDRDTHYLSARSIPPLKIPPGTSSRSFHSYYPVSDRCYPECEKNVPVVPPGLFDKDLEEDDE